MHKINLLSYLILLPFFCFSQNNKPIANGDWQTALVELNTYIKEHFDNSLEVKGGFIYNHFKSGTDKAKIKDLFYVIKLPEYKYVYLTCKNNDECVSFSVTKKDYSEFSFQCKTEAEMDKTFELLNDFWLKLTGIESRTKYTNNQLKEIRSIKEKTILLTDVASNEPAKSSLEKYLNMKVYAQYLFLNYDNETYNGKLITDNKKSYLVNKVKIEFIPNDSVVGVNENKNETSVKTDNIELDPNVVDALNLLNNYIKDSINYSFAVGNNNNTFEIKDGLIIKHLRSGNKLSAKIDDLYKVVKIPKRNGVYLVCKDNSKCLYNLDLNHYYPESEFNDLKSEAQMDRLFELFSKFWFLLTGTDSKTKYDNATLMKMQERLKSTTVILKDVSKSEAEYSNLSKFIEGYIEVYYLDLNYDYETYHGGIKAGDKWFDVEKIRIKRISNPELDSNTVEYKTAKASKELGSALKDYTTTITNNQSQNAQRDEAVSEMKKLAEKVKEYTESMKMYQKDCEKDKNYHKIVTYGRSTPCDNIISYNKMIKSAIERYLEKYQNYITEGDVKHLKQQISNAETNITNAKLN